MKRRLLALILVLCLMLSMFSGCGKKEENTVAKTYLDLAEDFINEKDYDSAVEILQQGLDATGDKDVAEMLEKAILLQVNGTSDTDDNRESKDKESIPPSSTSTDNTNTNTDSINAVVTHSADDIAYLNSFLSVFAAQQFGSPDGSFTNQDLLSFAYLYCMLYEPESIQWDTEGYPIEYAQEVLPAARVDAVLQYFFNRTITHPTSEQWVIENWAYYDSPNSNYRFVCADGGYFGYVAIIDSIDQTQTSLYEVQFTIYEVNADVYYGNGEAVDSYFHLTTEEAAQHADLSYFLSGVATLGYRTLADDPRDYYVHSYQTWILNARPDVYEYEEP